MFSDPTIMEENGNCAVTSESVEDLSEYTDADESMSAPTEILAEVISEKNTFLLELLKEFI